MKLELDVDVIYVDLHPSGDRIYLSASNLPPGFADEEYSLTLSCITLPGTGIQYVREYFHMEPVIL